jgi:predicted acylesterase/phospholipase RssA
VPILEALLAKHSYGLIMGVSAGAVNGVFAAQGDVAGIRDAWEESTARRAISSVPGALSLSHRPWHNLYSLAPLQERLEQGVSLDRIGVDFACGVVVRDTREYRLLVAGEMVDDEQLHAAIMASSSIAGLMPPVFFRSTATRSPSMTAATGTPSPRSRPRTCRASTGSTWWRARP